MEINQFRALALLILLVDIITVGVPLCALAFLYIVFFKPKLFKQLVDELYSE